MKSILIVSHAMELGGAERALLGLLEYFDYSAYQVDLFLLRHQGELLQYIPKEVNLLPENSSYNCLAVPIMDVLKKGKLDVAFCRYLGKRKAKKRVEKLEISGDNAISLEYSHKYTERCMPMISEKEYDAVLYEDGMTRRTDKKTGEVRSILTNPENGSFLDWNLHWVETGSIK